MKSRQKIRWGMIGCGSVAEKKSAPAYQAIDEFELLGVAGRRVERARDYAQRHNVPMVFHDGSELIAAKDIDAVYIATPPDSHMEYALKVAEAGKICCIEKPMAINYSQSLTILSAFERSRQKLYVAYYRRCLPRFQVIKKWLEEGKIGRVNYVRWTFFRSPSELDKSGIYNWRTDAKIAPGGYFEDLGCHGLDLIIYLLGRVKEVSGLAVNQSEMYSSKDSIVGCWMHENGVKGVGSWDFTADYNEDNLEIRGDLGYITFSVFGEGPCKVFSGGNLEEMYINNPDPVQLPFVEMIRDDLFNGKGNISSGYSACHTAWVMGEMLG